ncbi:glycoside hydrolase family 30 protein [Domibacillus enclensis]|uniref:Glucosylceramidase n=1 Tax=Domibacillus enclensis TaxID=1017273 RepID=A0A1N6Y8S9_9BACI|nr:glycoside hydrolase family 30 protein [Domibacillus enclensis]OXS77555.1 glycosyl hydrolase [Domibacillus enclensis]SIR10926.1 glucosylceramidase [Domibacillus enclensis]
MTTIQWIATAKDQLWQEKQPEQKTSAAVNITVTEEGKRIIEGFGGCFNELGYHAIQQLPEQEQQTVYEALFSPDGDCRFSICRLPIGASDYALEWYSHNETDDDIDMAHFSIERDRKYLIPYIKEALKRNPDLQLFASPWSPPTWMKFPKAYNYGTLRWEPAILTAYALYFVKFVQAYAEEGITIHQVHVQNEVVADQKFPSCVWTGEQLREFIRDYLGPAFKQHGLQTEIWLGTINGIERDLFTKSASDYDAIAAPALSDPEAAKYISGVGFQWAGKYALQQTVQSYPDKRYMQTENECGDGQNTWEYAQYVFNLYRHYFVNGANAYIYWNMILEPEGKSTWGWKQNAMMTSQVEKQKVELNPEYFVMKHFSHFVKPGARRVEMEGPWTGSAVAFRNPDNTNVIVVQNPFKEAREAVINIGGKKYTFSLEKESFHTISWK